MRRVVRLFARAARERVRRLVRMAAASTAVVAFAALVCAGIRWQTAKPFDGWRRFRAR